MIEEDVETLFCVRNVLLIGCRCLGFNTLYLCIEDLIDGPGCVGDVGAVTSGCID